jgi:tRNA dimethylallyltransferase
LILAGATASGKTELAIELAREFDAEIVGADSRQIYRGMEIGTAAPTAEQRAAIAHHVVGFLDPHERYSAARFARDALDAIAAIHRQGKRAIVAGGTGFYIRALTGGVELAPEYDESLRRRLAGEARIHPAETLHAWLAARDPRRAAELDPADRYRVLRALEIALAAPDARRRDAPMQSLERAGVSFLLVFLDVALDELDARIARRTDAMLDAGFVAEAERVGARAVASNAVGYPQALAFLRGFSTPGEMRGSLERATRRYARRQRAWFRGERGALWLQPEAVGAAAREKLGWSAKPA